MAQNTRSVLRAFMLLAIAGGMQGPAHAQLTLQEMFPFGAAEGDLTLPTADDNFAPYALTNGATFTFFNNSYTSLFVNNNGGVSFNAGVSQFTPTCGPLSSPMIIPYWADIDTRKGGAVWYRESRDPTLIAKATTEIRRAFPNFRTTVNWLFIVTWADCAFFGSAPATTAPVCVGQSAKNTFQLILVSDGTKSYDIFNYNQINWTTGTASGGDCNGLGGTPAKAGFDVGDGRTFFSIEGSCNASILGAASTTNVARPGQWIFRVDQGLEEPEPMPEPEPTTEAATEPTTEPTAEPTTEAVTEPATTEPSTSTSQPATECSAHSCLHTGHCFSYSVCDHERAVWVSQNCSVGLFWNPNHSGAQTLEECYGSCDLWDNLSPETQAAYAEDESCFPDQCFYEAVAECGSEYSYHSNSTDFRGPAARLRCPLDTRQGMNVSLVWVQDRETCDFCYNAVNGETGAPCCDRYMPHVPDTTTTGPTTTEQATTEQSTTVGPDGTSTTTQTPIFETSTQDSATTSTSTGAPAPEASTIMLPLPGAGVPARRSHIHVVQGKGKGRM